MATVSETSVKIPDITTCSICLETFKEPKVLPCIHTFCLQCLDIYCTNKKQDELSCPLCRKVFFIPTGGVEQLPNNFFMSQLLRVNNSTDTSRANESDKPPLCELCSDSETEIVSTSYCFECDQHICDKCAVSHNKFKLFKSHQVVRDNDIPSSEERIKTKVSYCEQHSGEPNRLYCYDCKMIMCPMCVSKHNLHKLAEVSESTEKFREQLKDDVDKVSKCACEIHEQILQQEINIKRFTEKVASAESEISLKYDELISLMQSHKSQLMGELRQFKDKVVKQMENKKDEIERQFVITESFKRYCQELMNKGTACDVSRATHDLHARAEELVNAQDESGCQKPSEVEIKFNSSVSSAETLKNFIGELVLNDESVSSIMEERCDERICLTTFLNKPTLCCIMSSRGEGEEVTGVTVLGCEVFVVQSTSKVVVYKSDDLSRLRNIKITGSNELKLIVSCSQYNCLYICDPGQKMIYRYDLSDNVLIYWSVPTTLSGISLTKSYNVLATSLETNQIREYTTNGCLIHEISLPFHINELLHSMQLLSSGNYVLCHTGRQARVCIVDQSGRIIHSYRDLRGSGPGQLDTPCYLAVDIHDNVLVADNGNNRVVLLSSTLIYLGDIKLPKYDIKYPSTLHFDERNHRLYIGGWSGKFLFVLDVNVTGDS